jgi:ABC-type branched-subunit amino acid transport system ATPase component
VTVIRQVAGAEVLLEAKQMSTGYGRVAIVRDLDLRVNRGEVVVLLGPNGAGKTTTILTLAGLLPLQSGTVEWLGRPTTSPLHRRVREGLALVPEERATIAKLTTRGNLRLGAGPEERALELFPELRPLLDRRAGLLSGGEQRMLALARALAADPSMLLADELSLGLAPRIVRRLLLAVRGAADRGAGVLLVEQHARQALAIADRAYVLRRGTVVMTGSASQIMTDLGDVESAYLDVALPPSQATESE